MPEKIITIEDVEDKAYEGKPYKRVMDTDGLYYNVKQGKEGALKAKWKLLQKGNKIKLTLGEYKGKPFVQDVELMEVTPKTETKQIGLQSIRNTEINISIETQVAAKIVSELWLADKLEVTSSEIKGLRAWICERLSIIKTQNKEESPLVKELKKQDATEAAASTPPEFKNAGEFLTKVIKQFPKLKTKRDIEDILGSNIEKVTDFDGAWVFLQNAMEAKS